MEPCGEDVWVKANLGSNFKQELNEIAFDLVIDQSLRSNDCEPDKIQQRSREDLVVQQTLCLAVEQEVEELGGRADHVLPLGLKCYLCDNDVDLAGGNV